MGFINIVRGNRQIRVSESMYDAYYRGLGFRKIGENRNSRKMSSASRDIDDWGDDVIDVDTIPVAEMTESQLKEYASKHGIDISGAKAVKDKRRIIQKHIQESKM